MLRLLQSLILILLMPHQETKQRIFQPLQGMRTCRIRRKPSCSAHLLQLRLCLLQVLGTVDRDIVPQQIPFP